jgi:predicted YcjX-like family ATPase
LIDHIRLDGFDSRKGIKVTNFRDLGSSKRDTKHFPYKLNRARIAEKYSWPDKTGETLYYSCDFRRSDWDLPVRMHFYDLPGERISDAAMFKKTFAEWSQHTLDALAQNLATTNTMADYESFCRSEANDARSIIQEYKLIQGRLIDSYSAMVTPSTFLLGKEGKQLSQSGNPETWAKEGICGINSDNEFAPMPISAFQTRPDLCKTLKTAYQLYQKELANPIFDRLRRCQQLLILMDIPGILSASTYRYNDAVTLTEALLESCSPKGSPIRDWFLPHLLKTKQIKRVCVIGTKSDMLLNNDIREGRLRQLLEEMIGLQLNNLRTSKVTTSIKTCASIVCTSNGSSPDRLRGYPTYTEDGEVACPPQGNENAVPEYFVSYLPETWPRHWECGKYCFPEVYPHFPVNKNKTPQAEGLWDIFNFICGEETND